MNGYERNDVQAESLELELEWDQGQIEGGNKGMESIKSKAS